MDILTAVISSLFFIGVAQDTAWEKGVRQTCEAQAELVAPQQNALAKRDAAFAQCVREFNRGSALKIAKQ